MQVNSFLRTLTIIHTSLCLGLAIFTGLVFYQNGAFLAKASSNDVFIYIVPILAMVGYFGSKYVYQNLIRNLPQDEPLSKKLQRYQMASIIKYALIEAPAFLAIFAYYFSGNAMHLVIALCLLAYLFSQRPTSDKIKNELPLNLEEKKAFDILR